MRKVRAVEGLWRGTKFRSPIKRPRTPKFRSARLEPRRLGAGFIDAYVSCTSSSRLPEVPVIVSVVDFGGAARASGHHARRAWPRPGRGAYATGASSAPGTASSSRWPRRRSAAWPPVVSASALHRSDHTRAAERHRHRASRYPRRRSSPRRLPLLTVRCCTLHRQSP